MAERRMFAKTIIDSDAFLDMPLSTQALYFHLSMRADDEGFINNPKKIQRMVGSSEDDLKLLTAKRFILAFDSGVIVIKHWKLHNYIRSDRFKPTMYLEEKSQLITKENKAYSVGMTVGIPEADHLDTQVRLGKVRLGKVSKDILSSSDEQDDVPYKEIVDYLNLKTSKSYKHSTSKTKSLIRARWNEGFRVVDFKKVIDNKCFEWIGNSDMAKYLRPETLFGNKFEGYLNENNVNQNMTNKFENIDSEWVR
ncbi:conserved phage C-terminal domain-containing protein [Vagococcus fluvialis]|uniref:conserved phage C-terminal domain-containing protein n=1 Tax=Vagococcus fluvialis TaxID=2738 RepID=UPI001D0BCA6A|nr:conserved phage C-terminal domain-containing protein [Vagococcus fluvialis]UDM70688.1 conserved phage C-terminal domain-containing protein [Vagococcus fluvialis]UDM78107.1 conserved phage C-terminal domain-containing protein [Vagococcus fluvialis]UDM82376.1 conserved phage C-terminal domain-containing protein [Vagococcus fluvialis]